MSRFKMPPRVAPSPAAGEPGFQNAAARLRSSRDVQSRLLEERRAAAEPGVVDGFAVERPAHPATEITTAPFAQDDAGATTVPTGRPEAERSRPARAGKRKLVVLFRLPLTTAARITQSKVPMH